jgi:hypothetical protein
MGENENRHVEAVLPPWGWAGTWTDFLNLGEKCWFMSLLRHSQNRWADNGVPRSQIAAWKKTFAFFQKLLADCIHADPTFGGSFIVFEYEIPFERGNRPDVILLLSNGQVLVIECKDKQKLSPEDYDQAVGYVDKLFRYHARSHGLSAIPILLVLNNAAVSAKHSLRTGVKLFVADDSAPLQLQSLLFERSHPAPLQLRSLLSECLQMAGMPFEPLAWLWAGFKPRKDMVQRFVDAYELYWFSVNVSFGVEA